MRQITVTLTIVAGLLLAGLAEAEPGCARVRGRGDLAQPAGPLTDWVGPTTIKVRGTTLTGQATVYIDPTLFGNAGPPSFQGIVFDWFTLDFGDAGRLEMWELTAVTPLDATGTRFVYDGIARPGQSYMAPGVYGPPSTGIFAGAHGVMTAVGQMNITFPAAPSSVKFRFKGQLCGLQLP